MRFKIQAIGLIVLLAFILGSCSSHRIESDSTANAISESATVNIDSNITRYFAETSETSHSSPLLWKVIDSDDNAIWLFGSIHVGEEDFYPLPDYIGDAFLSAEALAVEVNIKDIDLADSMQAMSLLLYEDGTKIYNHISDELYSSAVSLLSSFGLYFPMYDVYRPVMWMSLIDNLLYEKEGYSADLGIDINLMQAAELLEKEIIEIESVESQYSMLAAFSDGLQEYLLKTSIESYTCDDDSIKRLVNAWKTGDEEELLELLFTEETEILSVELIDEYNRAMSTDRNLFMTDFIEKALKDGRELFVCVGEAHMLGEDGIVALLRARGYKVEQISY